MDKLFSIFLGLSCVMFATAQVTVSTLNTTITNATCGTDRACISTPVSCNPETDSSCLFVSVKSAGNNLNFELRGESDGYIAVALSTDSSAGGDDKTYICANNNSTALFVFALLGDNNNLTSQNASSISNVRASINKTTIQCVFDVSGLNATSRANAATTFSVVLASGNVSDDGTLSAATVRTVSEPLDLSNASSTNTATATVTVAPSTNSTNTTNASSNATTTAATTAASGGNISLQHGLSQAVLILLGVLAIGMM